ncbi:MAG: spore coat associated protein CotJA [Clostridiales bacterium]|nr:spore coat associated protein CotJA [Clostridiales bacterium]
MKTSNKRSHGGEVCRGFADVIYPDRLSAAYVPMQIPCELYSPCEAIFAGTVFPELNIPYTEPYGFAKPKKTDCSKYYGEKGGCSNGYR